MSAEDEYRQRVQDLLDDIQVRTEAMLLGSNLSDVTFLASARLQVAHLLGHDDFDLAVDGHTLVITLRPAGWISISFTAAQGIEA